MDGIFTILWWNQYAIDSNLRTNNAVDGWQNRFHKAVRMDHPNIYLFVMHLRREQHTLLINLNQAALGYSITGRTSKYDKFHTKINDLFAANVSGAIIY